MTPEQRQLLERKRELLLKKKELLSKQGPSAKAEPTPKRESFDVPGPQPVTTRVGSQYKPSDAYLSELRGTMQRMGDYPIPMPPSTQPAQTPQSTYAAPSGGDPMAEWDVTPEQALYWAGLPGSSPPAAADIGAGAASSSTLGLLDFMPEAEGRPGYTLGGIGAMAIPWTGALKGAQAIPWLARLAQKAPTLGRMAKGAVAGAAVGGTKNAISAAKGEGFNAGEVGADIAAGAVFEGLGGIPKTLARRAERAASKVNKAAAQVYKSNDPEGAARIVNRADQYELIGGMSGGKVPIRLDEENVLKGIPVETRTTKTGFREGIKQTAERGAPDYFENPLRTHERYGTKEIMYDPVVEGTDKAVRATKDLTDEFRPLIKNTIPLGRRIKASERIMLYAVSRQKGGLDVLNAMGKNKVPTLTAEETQLYDYMRDKFEGFYVDVNKARAAVGLDPFPKQDNYFTWMRTLEGEVEKNGHTVISVPLNKVAQATPFRYEHGRIVDDYGPLNLDAFGNFERYAAQANRHIHLSKPLAKNNQFLDGKFVDGFDLQESNPVAWENLKQWSNFVAGVPKDIGPPLLEKTTRFVNRSLTYSVLGGSARAAGIQPTAIVGTAAEIGPKYAAIGIKSLFNPRSRRFALNNSHVLMGRQYDVAVTDLQGGVLNKFTRARKKAGEWSLKALEVLDMETAMATWNGAYRRGRSALKMSHTKAIRYADDTVTRTQASAARHDLAPIQRTTYGKAATQFQTFIINNWGFLTRDCLGMGNASIKNPDAFRKVFRYMVGVQATNILYEDVLHVRSPFPNPVHAFTESIQKHGSLSKAGFDALRESTEEVPILGGSARYGSAPLGAIVQWLGDVAQSAAGRRSTVKSIETAARGIGIPGTAQAYRAYRDVKK